MLSIVGCRMNATACIKSTNKYIPKSVSLGLEFYNALEYTDGLREIF